MHSFHLNLFRPLVCWTLVALWGSGCGRDWAMFELEPRQPGEGGISGQVSLSGGKPEFGPSGGGTGGLPASSWEILGGNSAASVATGGVLALTGGAGGLAGRGGASGTGGSIGGIGNGGTQMSSGGRGSLSLAEQRCQAACATCVGDTCVVDCTAEGSCAGSFEGRCPDNVPCKIKCGAQSCAQQVQCNKTAPCEVTCGYGACGQGVSMPGGGQLYCSGDLSCRGSEISCQGESCRVECSGREACRTNTFLDAKRPTIICSGAASCAGTISCKGGSTCAYYCEPSAGACAQGVCSAQGTKCAPLPNSKTATCATSSLVQGNP